MSGLGRADVALLVTLVPLWAICTVLHVDRQISDRPIAWFPLYVASAADADADPYPRALRPWPDVEVHAGDVQSGDRLLAMGGIDLRGRSRFFVMNHAYDAAREGRVPFQIERDGQLREAGVALAPVPHAWSHLLVSVSMGLFATLILLRGRGRRATRAYCAAALVFSLHFCSLYGGSPGLNGFALMLIIVTGAIYPPLMLRAALYFPPHSDAPSRRTLLYPWLLIVTGPALYVWLFGVPALGLFGFRYASLCFSVGIASWLVILFDRYRRADARGRRQMHWGLYGFFLGTIPPLMASLVAAQEPSLRWIYEASLVCQILLPIFLFIAIVRDNLFDINRLITATMAVVLLAPVVIGLAIEFEPLATVRLSDATGLQDSTTRWSLSFVAVLLIAIPAHFLRAPIENRLFREAYRFEHGLQALRDGLDDFPGGGQLLAEIGRRLAALESFDPCAVFSRVGDAFVPVVAEGPLVPPAFATDGPLPAILESSGGSMLAAGWRRLSRAGVLSSQETAQLQSLGAEVLLPILREDQLAAFVVLGAKRSGDVYSRTEIALLESLAERVGLELARHERDALLHDELALHEELAHYAPGIVVEELTRGGEVAPGEMEVTVFFVDIRGYSNMARGRAAPEVFEIINRYTLSVSRRVRERGGAVVEFHGDGLMAAFGAPSGIDEKERRAVDAARAIVKDMEASAGGLRVGIGIATGPAFVGDIQSVDRKIWSVIGETTNLAARLEGLTKDLGAAVVIDTLTRERLHEAGEGFRAHDEVRIKGWDSPITVWSIDIPDIAREEFELDEVSNLAQTPGMRDHDM